MKTRRTVLTALSVAIAFVILLICVTQIPVSTQKGDTNVAGVVSDSLQRISIDLAPSTPAAQLDDNADLGTADRNIITDDAHGSTVDGELIVSFAIGSDEDTVASTLGKAGVSEYRYIASLDGVASYLCVVGEGVSTDSASQILSLYDNVAASQVNHVYESFEDDAAATADIVSSSTETPAASEETSLAVETPESVEVSDPNTSWQYYLDMVSAQEAWDLAQTSKSVAIAVVDTGILPTHEDLSSNIVATYDTLTDGSVTGDPVGHGTHVAGICSAVTNNSVGISGVSYNASLISINVFSYNSASGKYYADDAHIMEAYAYLLGDAGDGAGNTIAQKYNVRVINMSLGGSGEGSSAANAYIDSAYNAGILTVCAAGNESTSDSVWPSDYDKCLSVIATDTSGTTRADYSNYGSAKDISAPGTKIYSTYTSPSYIFLQGTSMASPVVAGVAALCFSAYPDMTAQQMTTLLEQSATDIYASGKDDDSGYGVVNAYAALVDGFTASLTTSSATYTSKGHYVVGESLDMTAVVSQNIRTDSLTYRFLWKPTSEATWNVAQASSALNTCSWTPSAAGSYDLEVEVSSPEGVVQAKVVTVEVKGYLTGVSCSPSSGVRVGQTLAIKTGTNATAGSYTYNYVWEKDNWASWGVIGQSAASSMDFTPTSPGKYSFYVDLIDNTTGSIIETRSVSVSVARENYSYSFLTASERSVFAGSPVTITASATGTTAYLKYNFVWEKDNWASWAVAQASSPASTCEWTPPSAGTYQVFCDVTDSSGAYSSKSVSITARNPVSSVSLSSSTGRVGSPITITANTASGLPSGYSYNYVWEKDNWGTWARIGQSSSTTQTFTPASSGSYSFYVDVIAPDGTTVQTSSATMDVLS